MDKSEIIIAIFSSGILSALVSHLLYSNKLKSENKSKANEGISKEIAISLKKFREIELELSRQELYNAKKEFMNYGDKVNMFEQECIYPEIFNNWNSFNSFFKKIQDYREEYEKNLPCKVALNVVYIDRYIMQLGLFMKTNGDTMLPEWGTLFICDLQKWQVKIDKLLVKEINKHKYKLESYETKKWSRLRKKIIEKEYKNTILYYLINGEHILNKKQRKAIDEIVDSIKSDHMRKKNYNYKRQKRKRG